MKIIMLVLIIVLLAAGCRTNNVKMTEFYPDGKVKSEYHDTSEGFLEWSEGNNKNMPFSNISVSGVGVGK